MTKPSITTRATKGSALTWTEGDQNLENLRDATITLTAGSGGTAVSSELNGNITLLAGTNITLSGDNAGKTVTINAAGGSGITEVVQDTSPTLGGDLDLGMYIITADSNDFIRVGNPTLMVGKTAWTSSVNVTSDQSNMYFGPDIANNYAGGAKMLLTKGVNGAVTINSEGTGNITLTPNGTGKVRIGASLDVNGQSIVSSSNGNINIVPDGTGDVYLTADTTVIGDAAAAATLTTNGAGNLTINTNGGTSSGSITINTGSTGTLTMSSPGNTFLETTGASSSYLNYISRSDSAANNAPTAVFRKKRTDALLSGLNGVTVPVSAQLVGSDNTAVQFARQLHTYSTTSNAHTIQWQVSSDSFSTNVQHASLEPNLIALGETSGTTAQTITTPRAGNLTLSTNRGTNSGTMTITAGANGNITITPNGTGKIVLDGLSWPTADGSANQVLKTDGAGNLSWVSASGGSSYAVLTSNYDYGSNIFAAPTSETTLTTSWVESVDSGSIVTVSGNNFTLGTAGTYLIEYFHNNTARCQFTTNATTIIPPTLDVILYNSTGATNLAKKRVWGTQLNGQTSGQSKTFNLGTVDVSAVVTIASSTTFNMRYAIGSPTGSSAADVYYGAYSSNSVVRITKIA